jgi:hypothetical protein
MTRNSSLERLEARIDHQAARIDEIYHLLKARGMLSDSVAAEVRGALFEEFVPFEDAPLTRERRAEPTLHRSTRLRVGQATGV